MLEVAELHTALKAKAKGWSPTPIVTFNAELDRIRTGGEPSIGRLLAGGCSVVACARGPFASSTCAVRIAPAGSSVLAA